MKKDKRHLLNFIIMIAMLLTINSHFDIFFLERIRFLATGDALRNSVFLYSQRVFSHYCEGLWDMEKVLFRFCKLYILVYNTLIIHCLTERNNLAGICDTSLAFEMLLRPTPYYFVRHPLWAILFWYSARKAG